MTDLVAIRNFASKHVARATQALLFILVALIPFSVRYVFESPLAYHTGAYSDFTSFSIYLSDFVLLALISLVALFHMKHPLPKFWTFSALAALLWLFLELFLQSKDFLSLPLYFSARIALLITFTAAVSQISVSRERLSWVFSILGTIQALIATTQFYLQKSLGLYYIGESRLDPETLGVAKIVAHGTKLIRGYGTFPHPNLLAAFLVTTTLLNLYLISKSTQKSRGIMLTIMLFMQVFGLFVTMSRGGIIAFGIGLSTLAVLFLIKKRVSEARKSIMISLVAIAVTVGILAPYLSTRTTISDSATKERLFYTEIGKNIVSENPIFGVGAGLSVLHMEQFSPQKLEPWEVQPIHNYWLILWSEWGIGSLAKLILLILPIILLLKRELTAWRITLASIGVSFFALFLIDHYFYTIWPTQLLLWLIIGLILREIIYDKLSQTE